MCADIVTEDNHPHIFTMNSKFMIKKMPGQISHDNTVNPSLGMPKNLDHIIPQLLFSTVDSFTSSFTKKITPAISLFA